MAIVVLQTLEWYWKATKTTISIISDNPVSSLRAATAVKSGHRLAGEGMMNALDRIGSKALQTCLVLN